MKKLLILCIAIIINLSGCSPDSIENVKVLGTDKFSQTAWMKATREERGKMVYSFLRNHDVKKLKVEKIRSLLGEYTAYYEYDECPAYSIGPQTIESGHGKGYLLAFPFDRKTGITKKYVIIPDPE